VSVHPGKASGQDAFRAVHFPPEVPPQGFRFHYVRPVIGHGTEAQQHDGDGFVAEIPRIHQGRDAVKGGDVDAFPVGKERYGFRRSAVQGEHERGPPLGVTGVPAGAVP